MRVTAKLWSLLFVAFIVAMTGCANTKGPRIAKIYENTLRRSDIAIVRMDQKPSLRILVCDGVAVPVTARYLLVQPGRHELIFSISGQTLVEVYKMTNKKYLDAAAGHTYMLRSKTGWFSIGDKWFPEVVDVTEDLNLHVDQLPSEEVIHHE